MLRVPRGLFVGRRERFSCRCRGVGGGRGSSGRGGWAVSGVGV